MNAHELSIAVFERGLRSLRVMLQKGEALGAPLLEARLAPDMYTLAVQAHWVAESARMAVLRLLASAAPPSTDEPKSFADVYTRIDTTLAWLATVAEADLAAGLTRTIEVPHRGGALRLNGVDFLQAFAIPSFYFHLVTAYGILRHEGVALTKGDFLGPMSVK